MEHTAFRQLRNLFQAVSAQSLRPSSRPQPRQFAHRTPRLLHTAQTVSLLRSAHPRWMSRFKREPIRVRRYATEPNKPPSYNPTENLGSPNQSLTLSQRFRKLSREYGYGALGVYLLLSAADFPLCFLAVRSLGTERIGEWEHKVVSAFWSIVPQNMQDAIGRTKKTVYEKAGVPAGIDQRPGDWGVEEAERANRSDKASLGTQLALAYAIHKSFIFVRIPLTISITPKVVKTLRSWGWNIGRRKPT